MLRVDDPQVELLLLRACMGLCRMVHVLRCSPTRAVAEGVAVFDDALHSSLRGIVVAGGPGFGSLQAELAALPLPAGGLGIVRAEDILPVAFLASVLQTQRVQEEVLAGWEVPVSRAVEEARLSFLDVCPDFDCNPIGSFSMRRSLILMSNASWVLDSAARPHASGWLQGLPVERMGQVMANIEFRCRLQYQLLIPMFPGGAPCPRCSQEMDRFGDHAIQCRVGRGVAVTYRHNAVRDMLFRIGKEVEAVVTREPPLPVRVVGFETRRPDLVFLDWDEGRDLNVDVVGSSPLAASHLAGGGTSCLVGLRLASWPRTGRFSLGNPPVSFSAPLHSKHWGGWIWRRRSS
eukprot:jgi/Botrbrau1/8530/Bobra.0029s0034.1